MRQRAWQRRDDAIGSVEADRRRIAPEPPGVSMKFWLGLRGGLLISAVMWAAIFGGLWAAGWLPW
jgi:hypothetical protein